MNRNGEALISSLESVIAFTKAKEVLPNLIPYSVFMALDLHDRDLYLKMVQPEVKAYEVYEQNMAKVAELSELAEKETFREPFRLPNRLAIGRLCWYLGNVYKIVASTTECWAIAEENALESLPGPTTFQLVGKRAVEVLSDEVFLIGDEVSAKYTNGFKGSITGYEPRTNRVVCESCNSSNGPRIRFAYKPYELINQTWRKSQRKK